MDAPPRSNTGLPHRLLGCVTLGLAAVLAPACHSPLGGEDVDLTVSAQALPGVGAGLSLSQRVLDRGAKRIDFELGFERQELADEGPSGDDWTRIWAGLRCAPLFAADERQHHLEWRGGVTWLRSDGEPSVLRDPGDYGGAYLGAAWIWELGPSVGTGPDVTVLFVDAEGDNSGSALVGELAWRWVWHL